MDKQRTVVHLDGDSGNNGGARYTADDGKIGGNYADNGKIGGNFTADDGGGNYADNFNAVEATVEVVEEFNADSRYSFTVGKVISNVLKFLLLERCSTYQCFGSGSMFDRSGSSS